MLGVMPSHLGQPIHLMVIQQPAALGIRPAYHGIQL